MLGYTNLNVEDDHGEKENEWAARNVFKYSLDYTVPNLPSLTVGLGGNGNQKFVMLIIM